LEHVGEASQLLIQKDAANGMALDDCDSSSHGSA